MKSKLTIMLVVLGLAVGAWGQGRSGGGGRPEGAGQGAGQRPDTMGRPDSTGRPDQPHQTMGQKPENAGQPEQQALKDKQLESGSWKMLQDKTGKSSDELKAMYEASGARNYGQFVSAVMVSQNLGLDTTAVLDRLKEKSLGQTLQDLGVDPETAKKEEAKAKQEMKAANSHKPE